MLGYLDPRGRDWQIEELIQQNISYPGSLVQALSAVGLGWHKHLYTGLASTVLALCGY